MRLDGARGARWAAATAASFLPGEAQQLLPGIDFGSAAFAGHVLVPETSWTARDDAAREVELQNIVAASSSVSLDPNVEEEEALQSV